MRLAVLALTLTCLIAECSPAAAQNSFYTNDQLSRIKGRNSASRYTSDQAKGQVYRSAVPIYNYNSLNRDLFKSSLTGRSLQKPFSSGGARTSVSPYLGLSAPFSSTAEQYYTQVRPQIQQQRLNQQQASHNAQVQHQLNSVASQPPQLQGGDDVAPTGHAAAFMNYGGYYQPVEVPKK